IVARSRLATDDSGIERMPAEIRQEVARLESEFGRAHAIGVACPGLVRREGDVIHWMKGRLNFLEGLSWRDALQRDSLVPVINDGHAALEGEVWLGAGRGCRDVVMLTLGTGVGGAILCDGRMLSGHLGRAGHLGHLALNPAGEKDIANTPGSLEDAIGNCTLLRRSGGRFTTTAALIEAHLAGDPHATSVWQTSLDHLAAALASIINAIDPQRIILGGGIAMRAGRALFDPLRTLMDSYEWRPLGTGVEILPAELGDEAGAIGSAKHAMEHYDAK
ncbi:MAG TPA: ROK family protein, partial [Vicinamibacterales bacterium]|nr:ROK family protein [Vicinamibacterales bacterium]